MRKRALLASTVVMTVLALLLSACSAPNDAADTGIEALAEQQVLESADARLSDRVISNQDLPPEGTRSLFDHLIRENGSLPFPFDRLMAMLAAYDADGQPPHNLLIPDGRSLLKGQAHFAAPRIVVAADAKPPEGASHAPMLRGRLFLGFVEEAAEIEVISYNEAAGRFEFQLVEDYCEGCVPRIVYAKRAICTTCHAGGGPIFPVRPWAETNVNTEVSQRLATQIEASDYYSAPIDRQLIDGQRFDDLTDMGNVLPTTQRIWLDGCGEQGNDCRRSLFKLALQWAVNPNALDQQVEAVAELKALQKINWPDEGIKLDNGNLKNRDPLRSQTHDLSLVAKLKALLMPQELQVRTGEKLTDFDQLPKLPAELDPLTRRTALKYVQADELDGVYGLAQMFSQTDIGRIEALANYDPNQLAQAVDSMSELHFEPEPIHRVALLDALSVALGGQARPYCCDTVEGMSEPIAQGEPPLQLAEGSELEPFETYCFACHRGNPSARLNFMSGASEAEVLAMIKDTDAIRDVLDYERYLGSRKESSLMPPADSWQREALEADMAAGGDPLKRMREQVPTLFEF